MPSCPLTNKLIENEVVQINSSDYVFLVNRGLHLHINDFIACELGANVRIVIPTQDVPVYHPHNFKLHTIAQKRATSKFYTDAPAKQEYKLQLDTSITMPNLDYVEPPKNDTPVAGIVAGLAMLLSVVQQVRQKKKEVESEKCCADSKVKFTEYDSKIQKLDIKIEERTKEESKALHAEMYEQYKELKELRDDSEQVKELLTKVVHNLKSE